jgi:CO/xanthine dehydrogenase FAD-binding subunit
VAIAILNLGVWLRRADGVIAAVRVTAGPAGPTPRRLHETEANLCDQPPTEAVLNRSLDALLAETRFRTSPHRASAVYRRHLAGVLLHETLLAAWKRTQTN